jgi:hypothetical protein
MYTSLFPILLNLITRIILSKNHRRKRIHLGMNTTRKKEKLTAMCPVWIRKQKLKSRDLFWNREK